MNVSTEELRLVVCSNSSTKNNEDRLLCGTTTFVFGTQAGTATTTTKMGQWNWVGIQLDRVRFVLFWFVLFCLVRCLFGAVRSASSVFLSVCLGVVVGCKNERCLPIKLSFGLVGVCRSHTRFVRAPVTEISQPCHPLDC